MTRIEKKIYRGADRSPPAIPSAPPGLPMVHSAPPFGPAIRPRHRPRPGPAIRPRHSAPPFGLTVGSLILNQLAPLSRPLGSLGSLPAPPSDVPQACQWSRPVPPSSVPSSVPMVPQSTAQTAIRHGSHTPRLRDRSHGGTGGWLACRFQLNIATWDFPQFVSFLGDPIEPKVNIAYT